MAFSSIYVSEALINLKAGSGANLVTGMTEANLNMMAAVGESVVNVSTGRNWSDDYSGLNDDVKLILNEAVACWIAPDFTIYDTTSYASRIEAEDIVNVNWAKFNKLIEILKDDNAETFIDRET